MEYADVIRHFGPFGYFELPNVLAFVREKRATVIQTLHRWSARGWIVPVRRGFYAIPDDIARNPMTPERAANAIYKDSYVTGLWRLNHLGLIPEGVMEVTSATRNNPAVFDTPIGRFSYRHLSTGGFFGYETVPDGVVSARVATPEKALLDFLWWQNIEWSPVEFARWRIQDPFNRIDCKRLLDFAERWGKPRLVRAAHAVICHFAGQRDGPGLHHPKG